MQQKRNINQKNFYKKKKIVIVKKRQKWNKFPQIRIQKRNKFKKIQKSLYFTRKIFKHKFYKEKNLAQVKNKLIFTHKISIVVKANNIFCNLKRLSNKKNLKSYVASAGKYKIKMSKKNLKYTYSSVLDKFLSHFKKTYKHLGIVVDITSAIKIRKKIINTITYNFKNTLLILRVLTKKTFNGCRPPKKIRKKRKGMRILK